MKQWFSALILCGIALVSLLAGCAQNSLPAVEARYDGTSLPMVGYYIIEEGSPVAREPSFYADAFAMLLEDGEPPYAAPGDVIEISFSQAPDSASVAETVLVKEEAAAPPREGLDILHLEGDTASLELANSMSFMLRSDTGGWTHYTRGLILTCAWGETVVEYFFVVRMGV